MSASSPHVIAYTDATGRGGGEMSLGNLVGALDPGLRVTVMGVDPGTVDWIARRRPAARTVLLPVVRGPADVGRIAAHVLAVLRLRPDVLHANLRVPWSCWYGLAAGIAHPRTVTVAVEQLPIRTESAWQQRCKRALSARLDAHVAVGEASARRTEEVAGLPPGSVRSIPNLVPDLGPVRPVPHDGVVLGAVGRLDPQKGFDVLLEALVALPGVRLVLVGEGRSRSDLQARARVLGVAGRVTFAGWSEDVRSHLAGFDVVVLPSRSEGFPLTIVEAMLAGLPVVATRVGSVAEAVRDGETGLLVGKDDPRALAAALRRLVDDRGLRHRMGACAREVAARHFTVQRMARAYEDLYAELLARARPADLRG
jgi:glycosyltransferase involved in cell wall biosynthesis